MLLLLGCTGPAPSPVDSGDSAAPGPPAPAGEVLVHLFEWGWADVALECERSLGPAGVGGVQVSPPQEYRLLDGHPWYERYQPVSYEIIGRSGDEAEFADMVARCRAAGVEIHVDAVLNHMAWANADEGYRAEGYAGTTFARYDFPGLYGDAHFHDCRRGIEDWSDPWEIRSCELATLPDLATEDSQVRSTLHAYLDHLVELGVAGFRVDAAKHVPPEDLAAVLNGLAGPPSVFQEVITPSADDAIDPAEYFGNGRVTEFRHSATLSSVFREGQLNWLIEWGASWGFHPSESALVFVDNHDNQRGHSYGDPLTYADGGLYTLANAFMLAWPYGRPKLMSSYEIRDPDHGPPMQGDRVAAVHDAEGACVAPWVCEHRASLGMVGFRNAAGDAPVTGWWDNGNDQIAFGREGRAFIVLNREELPTLERRLPTGLPQGRYCDVYAGPPTEQGCAGAVIEVDASGEADLVVGPLSAVALHVGALAP
ncbi:MAG: alpha-amylase family protein [Alphaproteobacteria bacterium]|nr:alpha-amylase family protein [Alphaproteobacteria bacterium]MCB9792410.1 alpha-amylase family protein [Alphaproteobacteria bacterium]